MQQTEFITDNPYLAAAITEQLKIDPTPKVHNGWTHFSYPGTDDVYRAVNAFNNGLGLNAFEYSQTIKRLRGMAITKRKEISDERSVKDGTGKTF